MSHPTVSSERHRDLCLSDETLKAVGPFYLVTMPGEVKYPTRVTCRGLSPHSNLEKDNSLNHSCVSPKVGCLECYNQSRISWSSLNANWLERAVIGRY